MNKILTAFNLIVITLLASMMLFGAYNHVANPAFYNGFIPDFLPKLLVNYFTALIELIIGILIIFPNLRRLGMLLFIGLMLTFFPVHIWDLLKETPAIGSKEAAIARLVVQFFLIGIAYFALKRTKPLKSIKSDDTTK